ncbi:MAG: hypothetical protein HC836_39470 [Richelia sp. RM2_1_2]|nr:hypothetical protein [Richelia sp. RM2_1_2]
MALIQELDASTLYLTGFEQSGHFKLLNKLYPQVSHIGLGLVMLDGKKMSSSEGNVIYFKEFFDHTVEMFGNNQQLAYNVLAGMILKSDPESVKNIDTGIIHNVKQSLGLYISYTMARMHSAGIELKSGEDYVNSKLKFASLKAKTNLKPNTLFEGLIEHCKNINKLYETHRISGNPDNAMMFQ